MAESSIAPSRTTVVVLLGLVLVAGLVVRTIRIDYLLPSLRENDAHVFDQAALLSHGWDEAEARRQHATDPEQPPLKPNAYAMYPHLMGWLLATLDRNYGAQPSPAEASTLKAHLASASAPLVRARYLCMLLSFLAVPATWLALRRVLGVWPSLLAVSFLSFSLLHATISQEVRPHAPFVTFVMLSVIAALRIRARPTATHYVLGGLAAGGAVGCLPFGMVALVPLGVAHLLRDGGERRRTRYHILLPLIPFGACVALFYPFAFAGKNLLSDWLGGQYGASRLTTHHWQAGNILPSIGLLGRYDPVLIVLAGLGLVFLACRCFAGIKDPRDRERARDALVILAYPLALLVAVTGLSHNQARFMVSLIPFMAAAAGHATWLMATFLTRRIGSLALAVAGRAVLCSLALAIPVFMCFRLVELHMRLTTLELAALWIERHADISRDRIAISSQFSLPLLGTPPSNRRSVEADIGSPWEEYQHTHKQVIPAALQWDLYRLVDIFPIRENTSRTWWKERVPKLRNSRARYIVARDMTMDGLYPLLDESQLPNGWKLVCTIASVTSGFGINVERGYQDIDMFLRVWRGVAWGPALRIYETDLSK